ncbi:MAG: gamma carbonic anhydrase family protein [Gemmiger sp.]|nr:gamma carbonic anhydrase family protein [Gemmiger sp.]
MPQAEHAAFVAENATLVGDVHLGEGSSVWYGAVLRGDSGSITVGPGSNIQDNAVLHTGTHNNVTVGSGVTVGHSALVHGCTVGDNVLVGMHATILNGAVVGEGSLIAAGALIPEGAVIPPHSLVMGVPGKVKGPVTPEQAAGLPRSAAEYQEYARRHAAEK